MKKINDHTHTYDYKAPVKCKSCRYVYYILWDHETKCPKCKLLNINPNMEVIKMQNCNENTHTDRLDADFDISLHEYGIVRNPITNDTVFCLNPTDDFPPDNYEYQYSNFDITPDDVIEALNEAEPGFFSFIGSDLKTELERIKQDDTVLSYVIYSLNQYNGHFNPLYY